jgi:hypothetical protein
MLTHDIRRGGHARIMRVPAATVGAGPEETARVSDDTSVQRWRALARVAG